MADESYYRASSTFSGWELRDPLGRRVGHVSRIFVGLSGRAVHVKVALGPFGTRPVLLPVDGVRVDREDRALFLGKARGRAASAEPGRQGL